MQRSREKCSNCDAGPIPRDVPRQGTGESRAERLLRLIHLSSAASRQLRRHLAELAAAFKLSDNELLVVWLCQGTGRVQVELAGAIGVSPAQMSGMVERLRARALVAMHRPTIDRRRQVWRTTIDGLALLNRVAPALDELASSLGDLSSDEERAVESLCHRLSEAAGGARGTAHRGQSPNQELQRAGKEAA